LKLKYYRKDRLEGFKTGQNLQADEKWHLLMKARNWGYIAVQEKPETLTVFRHLTK
jgi:hypothetical protein